MEISRIDKIERLKYLKQKFEQEGLTKEETKELLYYLNGKSLEDQSLDRGYEGSRQYVKKDQAGISNVLFLATISLVFSILFLSISFLVIGL